MNQAATLFEHSAFSSGNRRILFLEDPDGPGEGELRHVREHYRDRTSVRHVCSTDLGAVVSAVEWADLIWFEGVTGWIAELSNRLDGLADRPVVMRFLGPEIFSESPVRVDWSSVDRLIFPAEHVRAILEKRLGSVPVEHSVIRRGVDPDRFSIPSGKRNTKTLVYFGELGPHRGITVLLQFFKELLEKDPEYTLALRGRWADHRYQMGVSTMIRELGIGERVTLTSGETDRPNEWLRDKSHVLSFSIQDAFVPSVARGMAAGLKPLVHARMETHRVWPEEFVFRNLDEFLEQVLDSSFDPDRYRSLLQRHELTAAAEVEKIDAELEGVGASYPERERTHAEQRAVSPDPRERSDGSSEDAKVRNGSVNERTASIHVTGLDRAITFTDTRVSRPYLDRYRGGYEVDVVRILEAALSEDALFLDVGAHLGYFTLIAASLQANVVSFEPNPRTFEILEENVEHNGYSDRVSLCRAAFGDADREVPFYEKASLDAGSSLFEEVERHQVLQGRALGQVRMVDSRSVMADLELDQRSVVKIDIEGAEYTVLPHIRDALEEHRPTLLVEFHPFNLVSDGDGYLDQLHRLQAGARIAEKLSFYEYLYFLDDGRWRCVDRSERQNFYYRHFIRPKEKGNIQSRQVGFLDNYVFSDRYLL